MHCRFLLSDPRGDIELSPADLDRPFLTSPSEQHPFLTLADYFEAVTQFITSNAAACLEDALHKLDPQRFWAAADISEAVIRSEKHGAFYHIASLELMGHGKKVKFAVTAALSASARSSLQQEFLLMQQLAAVNPEFLPQLYCHGNVTRRTGAGATEFFMVLGEWLDSFHEWHLGYDPASKTNTIQLWDYDKGFRFLAEAECSDMLRQVAFILTCYYDQATFRQIYPWHHGAGDFVVRVQPDGLAVKLITARQHEPLVHFGGDEEADRLVAAIHFLLNLMVRIRLDRLNGVGEPAWIEEYAVRAAVAGFFDGITAAEAAGRLKIGPIPEFLEIMRAFDALEIYNMHESLLAVYAEEDEDDFRLIREMLPQHAEELHAALQNFSLGKL